MSAAKKVWIIIAIAFIILGVSVFVIIMSANEWDFMTLQTVKHQTTEYEITEDFTNISIIADTEDITILPSTDGKCRVVCYVDQKEQHSVSVDNGVLSIVISNMKKWYDYIGVFNFESARITVYLPSGEYGDLVIDSHTGDIQVQNDFKFSSVSIKATTADVYYYASALGFVQIHTSTGDINLENISAEMLDIEVSTGKVKAQNVVCAKDVKLVVDTGDANLVKVRCNNLISVGDTGDLVMDDVWASDKFNIVRDTGDVTFNLCDASEVEIVTSTGDVTGVFIRDMMIFASTSTGKIDVPNTNSGGRCEITTDTGDIKIQISK